MKVVILTLLLISVTAIGAEKQENIFTPELYVGASFVENHHSSGFGGAFGGGVRISDRHYFGLDMTMAHAFESIGAQRETNTIFGMRSSYLFSPVVIRNLFRFESGFSVAYGTDEYLDRYGTWGIPARFALGNRRVAWYGDGFAGIGFISDLTGDWLKQTPFMFSTSTGVRIGFGRSR